jgi:hypothetical protein
MDDNELLNKLYYKDLIFSFVELYRRAKIAHPKITQNYVKEWIKKQSIYQKNYKPVIKKQYKPIYSETPYSFQMDLTFMPQYKTINNNYCILFTAININTRFSYAYIMKDKTMKSLMNVIRQMETKTVINSITCDYGTEFNNVEFKQFCDENNITIYFVLNDSHKLGIINRFHRTLKELIQKTMDATKSVKWIDFIDKVIYNYNHSYNSGIGIEPVKCNAFYENELIQYKKEITKELDDVIAVNDKCRIVNKLNTFAKKSLHSKYSDDIYTIIKVNKNSVNVINDRTFEEIPRVKKTDINIIPLTTVESNNNIEKIKNESINENKTTRFIKENGVDVNNIINGKRIRKNINLN